MNRLDVIVDIQYGDCGKGKVSHHLVSKRGYTHVVRYNGGANAGHTIYHHGKKFVTHQVPAGVFFGIPSIIGPGCVVDPEGLVEEVTMLQKGGVRTRGLIFVARNAHVVTDAHKGEDGGETSIGTTRRGIGPAYRDKHARTGVRAESVKALKPFLIDMYEELAVRRPDARVLAEGAQGFGLDIDWGDYPYVTSSHCTSAGALLNGFPPASLKEVWGVAKAYETYVGAKKFEPKDPVFAKLRELGGEYGATTGRPRQCNWIDMELLKRAVYMNGVTHLVFNKMDILDELGVWRVREGKTVHSFKTAVQFRTYLTKELQKKGSSVKKIFFSSSPERI